MKALDISPWVIAMALTLALAACGGGGGSGSGDSDTPPASADGGDGSGGDGNQTTMQLDIYKSQAFTNSDMCQVSEPERFYKTTFIGLARRDKGGLVDEYDSVEDSDPVCGLPVLLVQENSAAQLCNRAGFEAKHGSFPLDSVVYSTGEGRSGLCIMYENGSTPTTDYYVQDVNYFRYDEGQGKYALSPVGGTLTGPLTWDARACSAGSRDCNVDWGEMEYSKTSVYDKSHKEIVSAVHNADTLYILRFNIETGELTATQAQAPQAVYQLANVTDDRSVEGFTWSRTLPKHYFRFSSQGNIEEKVDVGSARQWKDGSENLGVDYKIFRYLLEREGHYSGADLAVDNPSNLSPSSGTTDLSRIKDRMIAMRVWNYFDNRQVGELTLLGRESKPEKLYFEGETRQFFIDSSAPDGYTVEDQDFIVETDADSIKAFIDQFEDTASSGGGGTGGSAECGDFPELLTDAERQAAQSCGTQTYYQFQAADALYDAIEANCETNDTESAQINYENYKTQVALARQTYDTFCN